MSDNEILLYFLIAGIAIVFFTICLLGIVQNIIEFFQELRYINNEISNADENEKPYWLWQRRRLWLSIIPFIKY